MNLPNQIDGFSEALGAAGDGWQVAAIKGDYQSRGLGSTQAVDKRAISMEQRLEASETLKLEIELIRGERQ